MVRRARLGLDGATLLADNETSQTSAVLLLSYIEC